MNYLSKTLGTYLIREKPKCELEAIISKKIPNKLFIQPKGNDWHWSHLGSEARDVRTTTILVFARIVCGSKAYAEIKFSIIYHISKNYMFLNLILSGMNVNAI